ncbi:hypothetical protein EON80_16470 [bacterium]|nr:MAG: hypothetical protein EON80_16470 [bacterium]
MGQWLKGVIYDSDGDLSPDGKHFIYSAANHRYHLSPNRPATWTAISRPPYLKAIGFWSVHPNFGGGLFLDNRTFRLNSDRTWNSPEDVWPTDLVCSPDSTLLKGLNGIQQGCFFTRLQRDGWQVESKAVKKGEPDALAKSHNAWTLHQFSHADIIPPVGRGVYWQWFQASNLPTGETLGDQSWEWADFDGNRLVWAQGGKLYATKIWDGGHGDIIELADFNDWTFKTVKAPY